MKKIVSTSILLMLAMASPAQAEIRLDLGGYFRGYAGYADQEIDDLRAGDFKRKSKIFFEGSNKFDNDLTVGFFSELFQENGNENISASYLYFEGGWGHVKFGDERGAPFQLQVHVPGADSNIDGRDVHISFINTGAADVDLDYRHSGLTSGFAYGTKITYLSPDMRGLRAGISFSPEVARLGTSDYTSGMDFSNEPDDFEHFTEAALRYEAKLGEVKAQIGGGYSMAGLEANGGTFSDDYREWNLGVQLAYKGARLGAAYNRDNGAGSATGDTENWSVGADYAWGAYKAGVNHFVSETQSDDKLTRSTAGLNYTYGPGLSFRGTVGLFDVKAAGADENDGHFATLGTDVKF